MQPRSMAHSATRLSLSYAEVLVGMHAALHFAVSGLSVCDMLYLLSVCRWKQLRSHFLFFFFSCVRHALTWTRHPLGV